MGAGAWELVGLGVEQFAFEAGDAVLDGVIPDVAANLDAQTADQFGGYAKFGSEIVAVLGLERTAKLIARTALQIFRALDQRM